MKPSLKNIAGFKTRATIEVYHLFSEVNLDLGAQEDLSQKLVWRKEIKMLPDKKIPWPRIYTTRITKKQRPLSDDFGLGSSSHSEAISQKKSATSSVAWVLSGGYLLGPSGFRSQLVR